MLDYAELKNAALAGANLTNTKVDCADMVEADLSDIEIALERFDVVTLCNTKTIHGVQNRDCR